MKQLVLLLGVISVILISGCLNAGNGDVKPTAQPEKTIDSNLTVKTPENSERALETAEPVVYYFYHPRCPNCQAVEPLIDYLVNNTSLEFVMCNVEFFSNCTNESKALALAVKEKTGFFGTPTAVVKTGENYTVFIGKFEVMEMVKFLGNYSSLPEVKLNDTSYSVSECIECHEKRGLDPPSTYTCSYCCHGI